MLQLFDQHAVLFKSWRVARYEHEGKAYFLQIEALLWDGSQLEIRDYLFQDGKRKYAYHWMEPDGTLRRRWDNAPHWPDVMTAPHHVHVKEGESPEPSVVTSLEELMRALQQWFAER